MLNENSIPAYPIPFKIESALENTKSYAVVLYDIDAFETTKGFTWIHWVIANLTKEAVLENESQTKELPAYSGGMTSPDKVHNYTLKVLALDTTLDLKNGFYLNELTTQMKDHILDTAIFEGRYQQLKQ